MLQVTVTLTLNLLASKSIGIMYGSWPSMILRKIYLGEKIWSKWVDRTLLTPDRQPDDVRHNIIQQRVPLGVQKGMVENCEVLRIHRIKQTAHHFGHTIAYVRMYLLSVTNSEKLLTGTTFKCINLMTTVLYKHMNSVFNSIRIMYVLFTFSVTPVYAYAHRFRCHTLKCDCTLTHHTKPVTISFH